LILKYFSFSFRISQSRKEYAERHTADGKGVGEGKGQTAEAVSDI